MKDLFETLIFEQMLVEALEKRYCFAGVSASADAVVLIDSSLPNDDLLKRAIVPGGTTIVYDGAKESAAQVLERTTEWAEVAGIKIKSISLLSHASAGKFTLGNEWISSNTLDQTSAAWESLGKVLAKGASINLFGCNLASPGGTGATLINRIASLTGAGVHASNDLTGRGGDWVLEAASVGATQTVDSPLNLAALAAWDGTLAPGVTITPTSAQTTTESGGTATFEVVLDEAPGLFDTVTIPFSSSNTAEGTVSDASLTFDALNWATPQTITVTGVNDDLDDGDASYDLVSGDVTSSDAGYDALGAADVADFSITNIDDDTAGFTVTPTSPATTTEAGGQATFDVVLTSEPTADVTISITSTNTAEGTVTITSLTFTASDWDTPQTVTVTGQNDFDDDGDVGYTITTGVASSADSNYNGLNPADVSLTNLDNDTAGFSVTPSSTTTTEAGGQATFDVVLTSRPSADVTISIASSDTSEGTVSTSSLTFTNANWNVAQTVTVTGVNDDVDDGNVNYTIVTGVASSGDAQFNGLNPADVSMSNTDNDTAGVNVNPTSGLVTTETGTQQTFNVVLTSEPTADVTISIASSDTTEGTVSTSLLTFTSANWNVAQTVTVTGVNDQVDDGDVSYSVVTGAASSADSTYNGMAVSDVSVSNTDNDTAGITVNPTSGLTTTEAGGTAQFTVVLNSQPTADVTIGISSSDLTEGTVSTSLLTFTNANWNVAQTVTITGVNDAAVDGNVAYTIITAAASSSDTTYNGMNPSNVSVSNTDNDSAGITVTPTSPATTTETGGQATFDVVLTSQPSSDVTITVVSTDTTEGTVSTSLLTFTNANWNVAQTVTVTGADDSLDDGDISYSITTGAASSADGNYNGMAVADVSLTNSDDDTAGITVSPTSGLSTTEAGSQTSFDVVLTSQPSSNVTIGISSNDTSEGTVSVSSLTFTSANWNVPQTVVVTSVDDGSQDGDISYTINTAAATSSDPLYNNVNPSNVTVTNYDNDPTGTTSSGEFQIHQTTSNDQQTFSPNARAVAADGNGNIIVVWSSNNQDGSGWGVYGRRFDSNGSALGNEFLINQTTSNAQQYAHVAADTSGNFVVTWASNAQDGSGWGVYARRYNSSGVAQGSEFRVNTTTSGDQTRPDIAMNASGAFVISWTMSDGSSNGVYAQRYNAAGVAQGSEFRANSTTSNDQSEGAVAIDSSGNFVIAWSSSSQDGDGYGVYAQRYNASGVAQGSEFRVNSTTTDEQRYPSISMDNAGNFVVVWSSMITSGGGGGGGSSSYWRVFGQRYNASGVAQGSQFQVNSTTNRNETNASIALDADGDFVVTWSADRGSDGSWAVYAQEFESNGTKRGGQFLVNDYVDDDQQFSAVALDPIGDYSIVWTSTGQDGSGNGVYGRMFYGGNNPPVNSVPSSQSVAEDATLVFSSGNGNLISISDPDAGTRSVQVTLTASNGTLTLSQLTGLTFTVGDGAADATMTFTGTIANINAALAGMGFSPTGNYSGAASVTITTDDLGNFGWGTAQQDSDTVNITVNAVNDAPTVTVPGTQSTTEDANIVFSSGNGNQISVADIDAASGLVRITLTASNGAVTLASLTGLSFSTGDGTADATMTFTGTLTNVNNALNGLTLIPTTNYNGAATLQVTANDQGNTGTGGSLSDTQTINVNYSAVNDAPVNNVPSGQTVAEDGTLTFSSGNGNLVSIADVDAGSGNMRVTLTVTNGTLSLSGTTGLSFTTGDGSADSTMTFTGQASAINAALAGMTYSPTGNYNGSANLQITTEDQGNSGTGGNLSDTDSVAITVSPTNDGPTNTVPGAQSVNEDGTLTFSSGSGNLISIADIDAGSSSVQVTLTSTNGTLSLSGVTGLSFTTGDGSSDATMTFTGTIANINAALAGMTYSPTANYNGSASVQIVTNDLGNSGSGGALSDTDTVNITVNPVNDAPVLSGTNNLASISEDDTSSTGTLVSALLSGHVSEVDSGALSGIAVTSVDNTSGTWEYSTDGGGSWNAFGAPSAAASRLLAADGLTRVRFVPNGNYNGTVSGLTFRAWDQTTGSAGATANTSTNGGTTAFSSATATASVTVSAVNDAPVNSVPGAQSTNEDTNLVFSAGNGNAITVSDLDVLAGTLQVTLSVTNGTLSLSGTTGLSFSVGDGSTDATMTFTGTVANINAALEGLTYSPTGNFNGNATLSITTNDQGNSGTGGALSDSDNVSITVNPVNDPPVNNVPGAQTTSEDTNLIFSSGNGNQISVSDLDANDGTGIVQVTLSATNGTLTLAGLTGLSFTTGDGSTDATMTFSGTLANVNVAMNGLIFSPTSNYNGPASVQIVTNDQGNFGSGGAQSDSDTVAITVNPVNDPPVNTVPGAQTTSEDTTLTFSSGNGNAISISDLDAAEGTGILQVTLTAANGTMTLASLTGLSFITGDGAADATMTFTGTASSINAALNGLGFTPTLNHHGSASVQIVTSDLGNNGTGGALTDTDTVNITVNPVNDPPVNSVPGAQTIAEDNVLIFSTGNGNLISISDVDDYGGVLQVTLGVTNGRLTLGGTTGLTFSVGNGSADATMTFTGTLADINAALNGLAFTPDADYFGPAQLSIVTSDQGNTGSGGAQSDSDTVNITVSPVNDAPIAYVPGAQTTNEDTPIVFSAGNGNLIFVDDIDVATNELRITLSSTNGTLTLGGTTGLTFITGDGTADATIVFTGTLNDVNAAIDGLTFSPALNYNGPAQVDITVDDQGFNGAGGAHNDSESVAITVSPVNDAPVISLPSAQSTNEDTDLVLSSGNGNAITITDVDVAGGTMRVTLTVTHGLLTLSDLTGLTFITGDGTADATMTFTGSLSDINAALNGLVYAPTQHYNGPAQLDVSVSDLGNTGSGGALTDSDSLALTIAPVNDPPVITIPGTQTTDEDVAITFSSGNGNAITIDDLDADEGSGIVRVTLTAPDGVLTLSGITGLTFITGDGTADGTMTFTGSLLDVNAALEGLVLLTDLDFNGNTTLQVSVSDLGNTGLGGALTDSETIDIVVDPVNDVPVNTVPPAQQVDEDNDLVFSTGNGNAVSIYDQDAGIMQVEITVTNGVLTLSGISGLTFITGDGSADSTMVFTGVQADINAALEGMFFTPTLNYNGPALFSIVTSDLGSTGSGGILTDTDTIDITVNAVNDAPVITIPSIQTIDEDHTLTFNTGNGNAISIFDLDVDTGDLTVTLTATNGLLTLGDLAGLTFITGDGASDAVMTFSGTLDAINAALEGLTFHPDHDYFGPATIQVDVDDQGNVGIGGALTDSETIDITVNPVNDAPVIIATPGGITYTENDPATPIDPGMTLIDVDDLNLEGATVSIIGYIAGEDVLEFVDQNGITGSFDAQTGVLTLSGTASALDYEAALRSVSYVNLLDNPHGGVRTIRFVVGDGELTNTPVAERTVTVVPVNDTPEATPLEQTINEDAGRTTIDLLSLFADDEDVDSALTLEIVGVTDPTLFGSIVLDPETGELRLDSAHDKFGVTIITIRATDPDGAWVETTLQITVAPVNDAPVLTISPGSTDYGNATSVPVDSNLTLLDVDSPTLAGATIRVVNANPFSDRLYFTDQNGITGSFDADTGTLTLSGVASLADYQAALRSVTYTALLGGALGDVRFVELTVSDGFLDSNLGTRAIEWPSGGIMRPPPIEYPAEEPVEDDIVELPRPQKVTTTTAQSQTRSPLAGSGSSSGGESAPPVVAQQQTAPPPPVAPPIPTGQGSATVTSNAPPTIGTPTRVVLAPRALPAHLTPAMPPQPVLRTEVIWKQLDQLGREIENQTRKFVTVGNVAGMTTTLLSVGYVIWCLRGGSLVATLLTTLPLWRWLDPLPVLDHYGKNDERDGKRDEDEERLRSMMD